MIVTKSRNLSFPITHHLRLIFYNRESRGQLENFYHALRDHELVTELPSAVFRSPKSYSIPLFGLDLRPPQNKQTLIECIRRMKLESLCNERTITISCDGLGVERSKEGFPLSAFGCFAHEGAARQLFEHFYAEFTALGIPFSSFSPETLVLPSKPPWKARILSFNNLRRVVELKDESGHTDGVKRMSARREFTALDPLINELQSIQWLKNIPVKHIALCPTYIRRKQNNCVLVDERFSEIALKSLP